MSVDANDDILEDFLVEAGEILEQLGEQLVVLEQRPEDRELLNAVFRGFHTIKGGASFLNLSALVEVCHRAEDVFNLLRQGGRRVDAELMDAVLRVIDTLNQMFAEVRAGAPLTAAEAQLLAQLEALAQPPVAAAAAPATPAPPKASKRPAKGAKAKPVADAGRQSEQAPESGRGPVDEISDAEFEALLDQLQGHTAAPPRASAPGGGGAAATIADDEFEALLDQIHGSGQAPGVQSQAPAAPASPPAVAVPSPAPTADASSAAAERGGVAATAVQSQAETTVRVDTRRLDDIMNLVGELVLVRNRLDTLKASMADENVAKAVSNLDVVTADLQAVVMKTRMQPIKKVFGRFPRVVRDLARSLNKQVNLELRGEDTDLDKNLVEALADPLVHLVRNAVDHGLEGPEERVAAGKPATGTVVLAAEQEGDHILLLISDDGRGMDPQLLRRKAVERGLLDEAAAARMSDSEAYNVIFLPGLSTKTEISDVSGRGVGMDVVKTRIAQLNGSIEIESKLGAGSTIRIKVPLTLAILPTLMVVLGQQRFALPLANVNEIFNLDLSRTKMVDGQEVVLVREKALPLFHLRRWLVRAEGSTLAQSACHVVLVHVGNQRVGFVVDQLIGQEEVVIKPLGTLLHGLPGLAGATITGDGRIALILDVPSLMKAYARRV